MGNKYRYCISWCFDKKKFLYLFRNKIIYSFMIFVATKLWQDKKFFPPLLVLLLDPGSGMDKNQDPGSGINIPDPQFNCVLSMH
jgi:hypothetical protein